MPYDPHGYTDDEGGSGDPEHRRFDDFDCPACNANNPYDEPFGDGDEIRCFYCGQEYRVRQVGARRFKLREL